MAENEPASPGSGGVNAPQDIDLKIAQLEGKLKSDYLGAGVVISLGVAMPLLLLGLKYMQAISFGGVVQVLLWAMLLISGLIGIGIANNIGEYGGQLRYLQQQKVASGFKFSTGSPQLQQLAKETLQHLHTYYNTIQQENNSAALFAAVLVVAAMLLAAAAILALSIKQGIGNYILLGSAVVFALLSVFAYTRKRKETAFLLEKYGQKLSAIEELTTYLYLIEKSTDENEKKLMTQKMIDSFLNIS